VASAALTRDMLALGAGEADRGRTARPAGVIAVSSVHASLPSDGARPLAAGGGGGGSSVAALARRHDALQRLRELHAAGQGSRGGRGIGGAPASGLPAGE
jgi:hypothetical protein